MVYFDKRWKFTKYWCIRAALSFSYYVKHLTDFKLNALILRSKVYNRGWLEGLQFCMHHKIVTYYNLVKQYHYVLLKCWQINGSHRMLIVLLGLNNDGCSSCQTRVNNGLLAKLLLRDAFKLYREAISR